MQILFWNLHLYIVILLRIIDHIFIIPILHWIDRFSLPLAIIIFISIYIRCGSLFPGAIVLLNIIVIILYFGTHSPATYSEWVIEWVDGSKEARMKLCVLSIRVYILCTNGLDVLLLGGLDMQSAIYQSQLVREREREIPRNIELASWSKIVTDWLTDIVNYHLTFWLVRPRKCLPEAFYKNIFKINHYTSNKLKLNDRELKTTRCDLTGLSRSLGLNMELAINILEAKTMELVIIFGLMDNWIDLNWIKNNCHYNIGGTTNLLKFKRLT